MKVAYLLLLIVGIGGLAVIDWRCKLVLYKDARRAVRVWLCGLGFFIAWDLIGIGLGIFYVGNSPYIIGLRLLREFPIEEVFFLSLLMYTALVIWRILEERWRHI